MGNDVDVANATAQVTSTEALLPQATAQISADISQLSLLLALPPGALRGELDSAKPVPPVPPEVPVGLPADLARRRPDIRRAEAQLHAATAQIEVAVADLFPRLTLSADAGIQASRFADLSNWAGRFFSLGPSLEIPIFSGGARRANVRLQDVKAQEAAIAYAGTVLGALHEVENALTAYGTEQKSPRVAGSNADTKPHGARAGAATLSKRHRKLSRCARRRTHAAANGVVAHRQHGDGLDRSCCALQSARRRMADGNGNPCRPCSGNGKKQRRLSAALPGFNLGSISGEGWRQEARPRTSKPAMRARSLNP